MKKILLLLATVTAIASYAHEPKHATCAGASCCKTNQCDSINIPVFIVDGVEVQDISGLDNDDIIKVDIIKYPAITKIFTPRLGGIVLITTKSKKYLTPLLNDYNKLTEEQKQQRIPGQLLIR
ncbi:MAG: hypothetical protein BHV67_13355 [Bacteroidales bacterium 43_36]|nr:MAG: hypothetical protein BHV67_13355 [Bacteroidales bacterium 43_36]